MRSTRSYPKIVSSRDVVDGTRASGPLNNVALGSKLRQRPVSVEQFVDWAHRKADPIANQGRLRLGAPRLPHPVYQRLDARRVRQRAETDLALIRVRQGA